MIVADTSALLAVVFGEPDYAAYADAIHADRVVMSSVSVTESLMVAEARHGEAGRDRLSLLMSRSIESVIAVDEIHARAAITAWRRFGKGRHPASLDLGDCFSYATAQLADAPLLFKGSDFAQTDLRSALST